MTISKLDQALTWVNEFSDGYYMKKELGINYIMKLQTYIIQLPVQLLQKMKSMGVTFNPHIYALFPKVITLPSYFEITLSRF